MNTNPDLQADINALKLLGQMGHLDEETAAFGIAMLALHEGRDALSSRQKHVFDRFVRPITCRMCHMCGEPIHLEDLPDAYEQEEFMCAHHRRILHKSD